MAIEFKWHMYEEQYDELKKVVTTKPSDVVENHYGCVTCGNLCADIYYDECTRTTFSSGYETGDEYQQEDNNYYGRALDGSDAFNYEESPDLDNLDIDGAIEYTEDFESFKKYIEDEITSLTEYLPKLKAKAEAPDTYWVKQYERSK